MTDISTTTGGSITPSSIDGSITAQDVLRYIESGGEFEIERIEEDPEIVAARINARIMSASSADELFGAEAETISGKDYLNKPFSLVDIEWRISTEKDGLPFFAVFHIADIDGEAHVLTVGARTVCLKAAKAQFEGWLPVWVQLDKSDKPTASGYYPLDLISAPAPF